MDPARTPTLALKRAGEPLVALGRGHGDLFHVAVAAVLSMNLLDALWTSSWLRMGLADEANPLLAAAWSASPILFLALKAALVVWGCLVLHRLRHERGARLAMGLVALLYGAVLGWHLLHVFQTV